MKHQKTITSKHFVIMGMLSLVFLMLSLPGILGMEISGASASPGNTQPFVIGGFDAYRGVELSLPDGIAFEEARYAITTTFQTVSFTSFVSLTQQSVSNVDILVLSSVADAFSPIAPLSSAEQATLADFVNGGGCAILLPDNADFTLANESLLDPFGIDAAGMVWGWITATVTAPAANPVTNGPYGLVNTFTQGWPGGLTNLGTYATSLATNSLGDALAVIEADVIAIGSGKVIIYSDVTTFLDVPDGGRFPENQELFLNSIAYCLEEPATPTPTATSTATETPTPTTTVTSTPTATPTTLPDPSFGIYLPILIRK